LIERIVKLNLIV